MKNRASIEKNGTSPKARDLAAWDGGEYWWRGGQCQSRRTLIKTVQNGDAVWRLRFLLCCLATLSNCKTSVRIEDENVLGSVCVTPSTSNFYSFIYIYNYKNTGGIVLTAMLEVCTEHQAVEGKINSLRGNFEGFPEEVPPEQNCEWEFVKQKREGKAFPPECVGTEWPTNLKCRSVSLKDWWVTRRIAGLIEVEM